MSIVDEIGLLIQESQNVKQRATKVTSYATYLDGCEYEIWISKCTALLEKNFSHSSLYQKFIKASEQAVGNGISYFDTMLGVLTALHSSSVNIKIEGSLIDKVFISHAANDIEYVEKLVRLLTDIGVGKSREKLFCSSYAGYDIPLGEKIYDYLKNELNQNILVIYVLSSNYYRSAACLNEMGAAWITSKEYLTLLLPDFNFDEIKGAIDPTSIGFKINNKERLNSFREKITNILSLPVLDFNIWEKDRDRFLDEIGVLIKKDFYRNSECKIDIANVKSKSGKVELDLRFINRGKSPVVFQEVCIRLVDEEGHILEVTVGEMQLEELIIYGGEKRREIFLFENTNSEYNPRRNKSWSTNCAFCNA